MENVVRGDLRVLHAGALGEDLTHHYLRFIMDSCHRWRIQIPATPHHGDEGARSILPFGQEVNCPMTTATHLRLYAIGLTFHCKLLLHTTSYYLSFVEPNA